MLEEYLDVDFVLCILDNNAFDAALAYRGSLSNAFDQNVITPQVRAQLARVINLAKDENLVLFLGAGCSASAGLPTWGSMLNTLAKEAGLTDEELKFFWTLNSLDQAKVIEKRLGSVENLTTSIVKYNILFD